MTDKNVAPFTALKNKLGTVGAWIAVVILVQLLLILPMIVMGLFLLSFKFLLWTATSLF